MPTLLFTMINSSDFGKRLHKIIDFYGLSATAFSEKIAVNRSTISHLLSGRNKPSLEFVLKVLQKFPEVELYWLLNGKGVFPSLQKEENLFKQENAPQKNSLLQDNNHKQDIASSLNDDEIDKIIIFYKNGSFKAYKN